MIGQDVAQAAPPVSSWFTAPARMVDWLKSQMQAFFTLPARIAATRAKGERLREVLRQKGDTAAAAEVEQALTGLARVAGDHGTMQTRVASLFAKLGALGIKMPGLGQDTAVVPLGNPIVIPIGLVIIGGGVALGIAAIFASYRKNARIIEEVAAGRLTAEEAKALGGRSLFGINLGTLAVPLLALAGIFLFTRAGRRRMSW